jgi:hypothetical protein
VVSTYEEKKQVRIWVGDIVMLVTTFFLAYLYWVRGNAFLKQNVPTIYMSVSCSIATILGWIDLALSAKYPPDNAVRQAFVAVRALFQAISAVLLVIVIVKIGSELYQYFHHLV